MPIQTKQGLFLVHCTYCHAEGPPRHDADDAVQQWQQRGEVHVLEYATKDEIVSELAGRADASDGLLLVYEGTDDDGGSSFQLVWRGSLTMAYGLANRAALRLGDRCHPPRAG